MIPSSSATNRAAVLPRPVRRVFQNFLLVWLDANFNETSADFKTSLKYLRQVVASIETFTDAEECVKFLDQIQEEKAFMIVSGALGRQVVPEIENKSQLEAIYVFCGNKAAHEQWANKIPKVKGVYTDMKPICKALQIDRENCDRAMVSISFNGIDALFMYTQLLKEAILQIEYDDDKKSLKELGRLSVVIREILMKMKSYKMEKEYRSQTPIWWYTAPYFLYSMLNRGLRLMDAEIIMKTGFFIRHLQQHRQDSKMMHTCLLLFLSFAHRRQFVKSRVFSLPLCSTRVHDIFRFNRPIHFLAKEIKISFSTHSLTSMKIGITLEEHLGSKILPRS